MKEKKLIFIGLSAFVFLLVLFMTVGNSGGESSLLDQPAQSFMSPAGVNETIATWGVKLASSNGPKSLREVTDEMYASLDEQSGPGHLSEKMLRISMQPGNALNSILTRLLFSKEAIDAVFARLIKDSNTTQNQNSQPESTKAESNNAFDYVMSEEAFGLEPGVKFEADSPPNVLATGVITEGEGPLVEANSTVSLKFSLFGWSTRDIVDSNWNQSNPDSVEVSSLIPGLQNGIIGKRVGSRVLLVIPPALAYGESGTDNVVPNETLVIVFDILSVN